MLQGKQQGKGKEGWREGTAKGGGEWTRGGGGKMLLLCQGQVVWCVMPSKIDCGVDHWRHCGFMVRPTSLSRLKGHQVY